MPFPSELPDQDTWQCERHKPGGHGMISKIKIVAGDSLPMPFGAIE